MSKTKEETLQVVEETEELSPLYYFYSVGCGWCKKTEPIVDELIKEGHDILKLDLSEKENQEINKELKEKYSVSCGTPLFINADSGNLVCGFREKDVLMKWINGEEVPAPPRPTGPPPKPPFMGTPKKEIGKWKREYDEWADKNSHMPNVKSSDEILEMPRPKSDPPSPPNTQSTDDELNTWKDSYEKWVKENNHLPNLIPSDKILDRLKMTRNQKASQFGGTANHNKTANNQFYYIMENGVKVEVRADINYIQKLKQQYYIRESDGRLTKVVDDMAYEQKMQNLQLNNNLPTRTGFVPPPASNKPPKRKKSKK